MNVSNLGKICFCFCIVISSCSNTIDTENDAQHSGHFSKKFVTSENLFGVGTCGPENVWIVGFDGLILHSGDAGKTWETQQSPVRHELYDVHFVNKNTGWIVGKQGVVLKTTNGGAQWIPQNSNTDRRLFGVYFINHSTGWAVGTWGTILYSGDGGDNWVQQGSGEDKYYYDVFFTDQQNGWVVGEYGFIAHTENGGKEWIPQVCKEIIPIEPEDDFASPVPHLYGVCFTNSRNGFISGMDGIVLHTSDGGTNWKRLNPGTIHSFYQVSAVGNLVVAIGERGMCYVSSDGGTVWQIHELGTRFWLSDIAFCTEKSGWIIGGLGTILKTDDAGKSWDKVSGIYIQ